MKTTTPLLSVCLITYNHKDFIRKAVESILMQKTNFIWELIIADDFSTDGTREIIEKYQLKYSEKIKLILQPKNVGPAKNWIDLITFPELKYIAYLEGDDYWTDPLKLQKQVDILENNPDYSLCFHDAVILWEDKSQLPKYFCAKNQKSTSTIVDVIDRWFIPSASMVFKRDALLPLPKWFPKIYNGDWTQQMLLAHKGKIAFVNEVMSVYRKNRTALSGGIGNNIEFVNNQKIVSLNYINQFTNFKYDDVIKEKIKMLNITTRAFRLRKNSKILYWMKHPVGLLRKVFSLMIINNI